MQIAWEIKYFRDQKVEDLEYMYITAVQVLLYITVPNGILGVCWV